MSRTTAYAKDVVAGRIPACKPIVWACQRHLSDLERKDIYFDIVEADRRIDFFAKILRHYKGPYAGKPFALDRWQDFAIGSLFGWKNPDGYRRYHYAYIEVARKCGKSTLSSGIAIMGLTIENEPGAEVYAVATKEDQAKIVWKDAVRMIKRSPGLSQRLDTRVKEVRNEAIDGTFKPLGGDSNSLDGLNPSIVIADELHAWKGERGANLWQVIKEAFVRPNRLLVAITTAGYDRNGICWREREHALRVIDPNSDITDDETFALIYTLDEGEEKDWLNEDLWHKANPGLGRAKPVESMRSHCKQAQSKPSEQNAFFTKHLNIWTQQVVRWIDMTQWDACAGDEITPDLTGQRCYMGADLASTTDLASVSLYFPDDHSVLVWFFCPEESIQIKSERDKVPYRQWCDAGHVTATDGNRIDHNRIQSTITNLCQRYDVQIIGMDEWNSAQMMTNLQDMGLNVVIFRQGFRSFNLPSKQLETLIATKQLKHYGNPVLRWQAECTSTKTDENGNIRPVKPDEKNSSARIDGMVATIMAIGVALGDDDNQSLGFESI